MGYRTKWMYGLSDERLEGWMDGWIDGWMDGWIGDWEMKRLKVRMNG